jgi:hypothetical protein
MYILKIRGGTGKSDQIQLRDDNFTLIAYFHSNSIHRALVNINLEKMEEKITKMIAEAEYGKMVKINEE